MSNPRLGAKKKLYIALCQACKLIHCDYRFEREGCESVTFLPVHCNWNVLSFYVCEKKRDGKGRATENEVNNLCKRINTMILPRS